MKPKIWKGGCWWFCNDGVFCGLGASVTKAYTDWLTHRYTQRQLALIRGRFS